MKECMKYFVCMTVATGIKMECGWDDNKEEKLFLDFHSVEKCNNKP